MKRLSLTLFALAATLIPMKGLTQDDKDYRFHSVFIYNFTKYIEWPVLTGEMNIGIVNASEAAMDSFQKMAEMKSTSTLKFMIRNLDSPEKAKDCHIVFIPENQSGKFQDWIDALNGKPVLVITEQNGLIKKGSQINFVNAKGKLNIELNRSACEKAGLKISGQLLSLAILV